MKGFCYSLRIESVQFAMVRLFSLLAMLLSVSLCYAQQSDSLFVTEMDEVSVTERVFDRNLRSGMPIQSIDESTLQTMGVLQLSDAVKHFSGVVVKDFGGVGGMKTVSVRGLGAAHTGVAYDGIPIAEVQSGTVDIGRFSLDNVNSITLYNGQSEDIFKPARLLSSSSVLNIQHDVPEFSDDRSISGGVQMRLASFGFLNPSLFLNGKINKTFSLSLSGEYLNTDGDYPFDLNIGKKKDSTFYRKNSDVEYFRIEPGVYADFGTGGNVYLKGYYFKSKRGLPGAVIHYAPNASHQRLKDENLFVQSQYKNDLSEKISVMFSGKYSHTYQHYLDPDYLNAEIAEKGYTYYQNEYYLSGVVLYRIFPALSISLSTDGFINNLDTDTAGYVCPTRYSWLTSLSAKYVTDRITITGALLATFVNNTVEVGKAGDNYRRITPSLSVSVKPFAGEDFRIRAFYKRIFRLPTFNDLYYSQIGNRNIQPEYTDQYDLGLIWTRLFSGILNKLSISADAYYNRVEDKIVALPVGDLFFWRVLNKGLVDIKGIDVVVESELSLHRNLNIAVSGNYTYQQVLDKSDPESKLYNNKLPYSPDHIGAGAVAFKFPWFTAGYTVVFSGDRYFGDQNDKDNLLSGYADQNISLRKDFSVKRTDLFLSAELLNIADKQYSVVNGYPMPGRSFRFTVSCKF